MADAQTMRIDLHCHSLASHDCLTPLEAFPDRCRARGVKVQAITDHDQIWGAQKLKKMVEEEGSDLTVIVGEEVTTSEGEIIGLFLQEHIKPGGSPEETVAQIKAQGGLVLLPHGFDPLKRARLQPGAHRRIADDVDIVEVFNARISRPRYNQAARTWASERGLPMSGGSDAHTVKDLGSAWSETPVRPVTSPADLLAALHAGEVSGEWTHPVQAFVYKMWNQTKERVKRRF